MELGYLVTRDFRDGIAPAGPALLMCMPDAVVVASLREVQSHEFFQSDTFMNDKGQCFLTWSVDLHNHGFKKWASDKTLRMDDDLARNIYLILRSIYRRIIDDDEFAKTNEERATGGIGGVPKMSDEFQMTEWREMFNYVHPVLKSGLNRH